MCEALRRKHMMQWLCQWLSDSGWWLTLQEGLTQRVPRCWCDGEPEGECSKPRITASRRTGGHCNVRWCRGWWWCGGLAVWRLPGDISMWHPLSGEGTIIVCHAVSAQRSLSSSYTPSVPPSLRSTSPLSQHPQHGPERRGELHKAWVQGSAVDR